MIEVEGIGLKSLLGIIEPEVKWAVLGEGYLGEE